ncbi:MAG: hypothetical protein KF819_25895 [Labilithrix sp.]|nr:hypothetical protein [Labilithrix sp.]
MTLRNAFFALATASLLGTFALTGCAADAQDDDQDDVEETADELTAAGKKLIGSYKDDSGAFKGLVLTDEKVGQGNKFFADVDTGIRCVRAPCPSSERIEGVFTAGTKTITLKSTTASSRVQHLLGQYKYLVQGDKFSIWKKGFSQSLEKSVSYCAEASDCYRQQIIHPMCLGQFTCGATSSCSWKCGVPLPVDPCVGLEQAACTANSACSPTFGPSVCSPDGRICTRDFVFKGCKKKTETVCLSSATCGAGEHCSTEDGVCNSYGMLAVCAGTCVP